MSAAHDLTGQRFGRLVAIKCIGSSIHKRKIWLCKCDCGNEAEVLANSLRTGRTVSCKCYTKEWTSKKFKTHGSKNNPEYNSWLGMKNRCYNESQPQYKDYGGRGIIVCDRWMNSFENFISDMGTKPTQEHSLDRIDYNGNYEPSNCRWATGVEQNNNKRSNVFLEFNGERLSLKGWCGKLKIHPTTLYKYVGLTPSEALAKIYNKHILKQNISKEMLTNNKSPEGFDAEGLIKCLNALG